MKLQDLFDKVRDMDIEEPACMDKVLMYLEDLNEESENYMQLLGDRFNLVTIWWEQPWYQQASCLTRPFNLPANEHEEPYQKGPLTIDEIELLKKNWRKLVKKFDIPDKLECLARWKNRELNFHIPEEHARRFVVSYLARGLKRTINQVYEHIVCHCGTQSGPYSKDEEKIMDICFHHKPKKAVIILVTVLGRQRRGIYKRLHYSFEGKPERNRTTWTLPMATKFLKLLMEYTGEPLDGLKNKKIDVDVWEKLEKDFKKQREYLQYFWNASFHCQLFVKYDVTLRRLRKKVFQRLQVSPYKIWHDIRWKELVKEFPDGFTHQFLYSSTVRIFRFYPKYTRTPLQELLKIGFEKTRLKRFGNKRLKTLTLDSKGDLEVIRYPNKF